MAQLVKINAYLPVEKNTSSFYVYSSSQINVNLMFPSFPKKTEVHPKNI